jgi:energy-coupling factor transport system permease protein
MTRLLRQANAVSKGLFAISICTYAFLCPDWRILVGLGGGLLLVLGLTGELDRIVLLLVGVFLAALPMLLCFSSWGGVEKGRQLADGFGSGSAGWGFTCCVCSSWSWSICSWSS